MRTMIQTALAFALWLTWCAAIMGEWPHWAGWCALSGLIVLFALVTVTTEVTDDQD